MQIVLTPNSFTSHANFIELDSIFDSPAMRGPKEPMPMETELRGDFQWRAQDKEAADFAANPEAYETKVMRTNGAIILHINKKAEEPKPKPAFSDWVVPTAEQLLAKMQNPSLPMIVYEPPATVKEILGFWGTRRFDGPDIRVSCVDAEGSHVSDYLDRFRVPPLSHPF